MSGQPERAFERGVWHAPGGPSETTGTKQPALFGLSIDQGTRIAGVGCTMDLDYGLVVGAVVVWIWIIDGLRKIDGTFEKIY